MKYKSYTQVIEIVERIYPIMSRLLEPENIRPCKIKCGKRRCTGTCRESLYNWERKHYQINEK